MNKGKTIFSQIMSLIPERDFKTCVDRYKGNYRARNFSCKDQFLVMSYAQLTGRDSLRDIENCLTALSSKLYHCGISYAVPRNTLAKANEKRDWHIYKDFADVLLKKVRPLYVKDKFRLDLDNMVYAFDSSTISLCLKLCPWAKYRKNKGGIKMHTLVDLRGNLPVSVYLTSASVNDVKALDDLYIEPSAIYLMDRGYVDFNRLFKLITKKNAFFVTRAKDNMLFEVVSEAEVDKSTGIISDERIKLTGLHTANGILKNLEWQPMRTMQQVRCIGFSQTTWNMKRLPYLNYIGKDGTWNFTLNGLSNTFTSNPFMELPRMPYICKSGLPYAHTCF